MSESNGDGPTTTLNDISTATAEQPSTPTDEMAKLRSANRDKPAGTVVTASTGEKHRVLVPGVPKKAESSQSKESGKVLVPGVE